MPIRTVGMLLALVLPTCGCALLAKKPPTPAARIDGTALARTSPSPNEHFYLIVFGSQDALRRPKYTHTFATLIHTVESPGQAPQVETHTISWFPATADIHPLRRYVEPGHNFTLPETLDIVLGNRESVDVWGPYEVWHGFAFRFLTQKAFLESGAIGYQCDDSIGEAARTGDGCSCTHAISDMDPVYPRWRYPLFEYGHSAARTLVRRFMHSPVTIQGCTTHDWLIERIGLNAYPIERRQYHGRIVPFEPGDAGLDAR